MHRHLPDELIEDDAVPQRFLIIKVAQALSVVCIFLGLLLRWPAYKMHYPKSCTLFHSRAGPLR